LLKYSNNNLLIDNKHNKNPQER